MLWVYSNFLTVGDTRSIWCPQSGKGSGRPVGGESVRDLYSYQPCARDAGNRTVIRKSLPAESGGEIVVYETSDGEVRVDVRLDRETVWLTQRQMAEVFGTLDRQCRPPSEERLFERRVGRRLQLPRNTRSFGPRASAGCGRTLKALQSGRRRLRRLPGQFQAGACAFASGPPAPCATIWSAASP